MNDQDNLDQELSRALRQQADGIGGSPIGFEQVKGTARGIRRRRALAASAAVAAAFAIVVPTVLAGDLLGGDSGSDDLPPATQSASVTPTEKPTDLNARDLETGDTPSLVWIANRVLHDGDREVPLDATYDSVVKIGDRYVVTGSDDQGDRSAVVLDENGVLESRNTLSGGARPNADGTIVAWTSGQGEPMVLQPGLDEPLQLAAYTDGNLSNHNVVGVRGDDCTTDAETTEGGGCTVFFTADDAEGLRSTYVSSSHGFADVAAAGQAITTIAEDGLRTTIVEVRDDGTCSDLTDQEGALLWNTCAYRGMAFSPDGTKLLAHDGYGDGFGDGRLAVLDAADGEPLLDLLNTEATQAAIFDQVWEDDSHVLAVVFQDQAWSVVRFGVDGSREYAVAPQPGDDMERPFVLAR